MKKILKPEDIRNEDYKVFRMFNDDWALATAGTIDDFNTCTIAWGSLGDIWGGPSKGRSIVTIYINPNRYTNDYLMENEYFTVSFFDSEFKPDLAYLGSHSGRDEDKVSKTKLIPEAAGHGVDFEQAYLTFVCKKIYYHQFETEHMIDIPDISERLYTVLPPHYEYIGEIVEVRKRENE